MSMLEKAGIGGVLAAVACGVFLVPVVRAQSGCPQDHCVESQTSLVYDQEFGTMDAYSSVYADYQTATYYELCVDIDVGRYNGPPPASPTMLRTLGSPSCGMAGGVIGAFHAFVPTPGRQYFVESQVLLRSVVTYEQYSSWHPPGCDLECSGWVDMFGYSSFISTVPNPQTSPGLIYIYPRFVDVAVYPLAVPEILLFGSYQTAWSPPRIDSVVPNVWAAGATTTFVISGAGFGYAPTLAIEHSGVPGPGIGIITASYDCSTNQQASCDTQIVGTVTIGANTPAGSVERITVTAGGMNASGFLPVGIPGQSGQATAQATTAAFNPPAPKIMLGTTCSAGTNVAGTTQNVVVGQRIAFTACIPESVPISQVLAINWDPEEPHGTAVGGYYASTDRGVVESLTMLICSTGNPACVYPKFYWVTPGNGRTFTFTYVHAGGVRSATITFNVSGPTATGPFVGQGPEKAFLTATVQPPPAGATPYQIVNVWPNAEDGGRPWLRFGKDGSNPGIYFDVTANGPSGSGINAGYQFIQLITLSTWKHRSTYESNGGLLLGLDKGWYPYARTTYNPNQALDYPGAGLYFINTADPIAESAVKFGATMYLMWDPALPSGCAPADKAGANPASASNCVESIPVPLGKIDWGFSSSAINTLGPALPGVSNQTGWIMENCGGPSPRTYSKWTDHPTWQK